MQASLLLRLIVCVRCTVGSWTPGGQKNSHQRKDLNLPSGGIFLGQGVQVQTMHLKQTIKSYYHHYKQQLELDQIELPQTDRNPKPGRGPSRASPAPRFARVMYQA